MDFEGKNVFVTGAGGYIGSFTAKEFASRGAKVTVFDQNAAGVKKTVDEINAAGGTAIGVTGDVTSSVSVDEAVKSAVERMGGEGTLDCLIRLGGLQRGFDERGGGGTKIHEEASFTRSAWIRRPE